MNCRHLLPVALIIGFGLVHCDACKAQVADVPPDRTGQDSQSVPNQPLTEFATEMINKDRDANKADPVRSSPALCRVAQVYADYLMRTGFFGHVDPFGRNPEDRARYLGVNVPVAENLAWEESSRSDTKTLLKRAHATMMNEPRNQQNHRGNILNQQYRFVGVGVAVTPTKVVLVQEFSIGDPDDSQNPHKD